jgi:vacuolar-type H+-ATPase subunit I/STV1
LKTDVIEKQRLIDQLEDTVRNLRDVEGKASTLEVEKTQLDAKIKDLEEEVQGKNETLRKEGANPKQLQSIMTMGEKEKGTLLSKLKTLNRRVPKPAAET